MNLTFSFTYTFMITQWTIYYKCLLVDLNFSCVSFINPLQCLIAFFYARFVTNVKLLFTRKKKAIPVTGRGGP
jgi:hypothetical protein